MSGKPTLNDLFLALHDRLACELGITRRTVKHNATMGTVSEGQWIKMLYEHLPKRYKVNRAFVIDSLGACSDQIDVVVHDRQYSPFVLNYGGALYVPSESVYAVFEVKQAMDAEEIRYSARKIASVRALHRTSVKFPSNQGTQDPKNPHHILGGILSVDCMWNPPFGDAFREALQLCPSEGRLDIGCSAVNGVFEVEDSASEAAPVVKVWRSHAPLALFILCLLRRLRDSATVPAIDFKAYASCLQGPKPED